MSINLADVAEQDGAERRKLSTRRRLERFLALALIMGALGTLLVCRARANQLLASVMREEEEADPAFAALFVENLRIHVIARNIANANTTRDVDGKPYQRQFVVCAELPRRSPDGLSLRTVRVPRVEKDPAAACAVYSPGHPDSDAQGFIFYPNINVHREMADLIVSCREYKSNLAMVNKALGTATSAE